MKWTGTAIIMCAAGLAWASGGWDDAKSKADEAKRKGDETQKKFVESEKKLVGAMCNARDVDNLKDAGRSAASDARSSLRDKLSEFDRATDQATQLLDKIDSKDTHHSDAGSLESDLKRRKQQLDERTSKMASGSPEFLDQIVRTAESARSDHRGRCTQKDFSADGERISCMIKDSDTCYVMETALQNSTSESNARDRARRGVDHIKSELKRSSPAREVNGCVHVEPRVDCIKVCPDVSDDGRVGDARASWQERCN